MSTGNNKKRKPARSTRAQSGGNVVTWPGLKDRPGLGKLKHAVRLTSYESKQVRWVWEGRIPLGKITIIDGDPNMGKSVIANADIAARVTTGDEMPDGDAGLGEPRSVVLVVAEDDIGDTVRPRLEAAGADLDLMFTMPVQRNDDGQVIPLTIPDDLETLLGSAATVSLSSDVDPEAMANSSDGTDVPVGVKVKGDADAIDQVLSKLATTSPQAGQVLQSDAKDGYVAIGPDSDYRSQLLSDGGLGDTDAYQNVVREGDDAAVVLFVNFDAGDWLTKLAGDDPTVKENVDPLHYKAFLVAIDRATCAKYKKALDRHLPSEWSEVVYSSNPSDVVDRPEVAELQLSETREQEVRKSFKKAAEQPKILTTDAVRTSDVVVTMGCGDTCPFYPGKRYEDWVLDDPAGQGIEAVRPIRDEIRRRIEALLEDLLPAA